MEGGKIEAVCNPVAIRAIVWTGFALGERLAGAPDYDVGRAGGDSVIARFILRRAIEREGLRRRSRSEAGSEARLAAIYTFSAQAEGSSRDAFPAGMEG